MMLAWVRRLLCPSDGPDGALTQSHALTAEANQRTEAGHRLIERIERGEPYAIDQILVDTRPPWNRPEGDRP